MTPLRILIVDDEPLACARLQRMCARIEDVLVVGQAGDGEAALLAIEEAKPDVVLLDIQMPGADGYETLRAMRAIPALQAVPIFAITASAMEGDEQRGLAAGFTAYLTKPLTRRRLLAALS